MNNKISNDVMKNIENKEDNYLNYNNNELMEIALQRSLED